MKNSDLRKPTEGFSSTLEQEIRHFSPKCIARIRVIKPSVEEIFPYNRRTAFFSTKKSRKAFPGQRQEREAFALPKLALPSPVHNGPTVLTFSRWVKGEPYCIDCWFGKGEIYPLNIM